MPTPRRIQRKRTRGWRMPPNTVYVGRPTKWGNPFPVGRLLSAESAFWMFCSLFWGEDPGNPFNNRQRFFLRSAAARRYPVADVHELRGKHLACWCQPGALCHADVLLEVANTADV